MAEARELKIVTFPWLAFGHMIPFLELSKHLAERGHHILYVSTTRNIKRLPKIPQNLSSRIELVGLQLPTVENLPPEAEATSDLHVDEVQFLKKAYDGLKELMGAFLREHSPDWVIYDFSCHWLPPMAAKLRIKQAYFANIMANSILSMTGPPSHDDAPTVVTPEDLTVPPPWVTFPTKVVFRLHEAKKLLAQGAVENASGVPDYFRAESVLQGCDAILLRSCWEIEANYLNLLKEIHGKPILPVGLLAPQEQQNNEDPGDEWRAIRGWLDEKEDRSVVYIAFGSEARPTQEELTTLALGLELSGLAFLWVLKKEMKTSKGDKAPLALPDGFEERTKGRGLVWTTWAPQVRILGHRSIGGFLSHSGWSSVIEALQVGLPLILLPMMVDQGPNARVVSDMLLVGYEVPRDEEGGSFTASSIAESIRLVVSDEGGQIYRQKAKEASREVFGNKRLQSEYIDKVVEFLIS